MTRGFILSLFMLGFGFSAGCGKKNADSVQASLSGKVSLSGKPVTGGQLIFHKDGKEVTNLKINPDGTYEGLVPIGDLQVGVETETLKKQLEDMASAGGRGGSPTGVSFSPKDMEKFKDKKMSPEDMMKMAMSPANLGKYVPIPEKYRNPQQSGLAVTTKVGKQEKDFDIP